MDQVPDEVPATPDNYHSLFSHQSIRRIPKNFSALSWNRNRFC